MRARALNLLVFREDRQRVRGPELKSALLRRLETLRGGSSPDRLIDALLRAGELECAVADAGLLPADAHMSVTDRLATALVTADRGCDLEPLPGILAAAAVREEMEVSPPEGFAYYALHPLAFAEALARIPSLPARVAIIGIRSIGTTLSAIAAAAARARGHHAERITVRPRGHPYNRRTQFSPPQLQFIRRQLARGAAFVIVDEGPGLSGSSFLSVAEALQEAGAAGRRIVLLCGHEPDFDSLRSENGPQRARRFQWLAISSQTCRPARAELFVGGGKWRKLCFAARDWPASWISFERLKYLSSFDAGKKSVFKFNGFGHYGEKVLQREEIVAGAGFGVPPRAENDAFASYPWIIGRPMSAEDLSESVLKRLAAYCAFRAKAFSRDTADLNALEQMAEHNLRELRFETPVRLRLERPALADGRMLPHEWVLTLQGQMLKTDSGSHGDDHFFPGITDIAWDLAGAMVEWRMNAAQSEMFLEGYRCASGDDASSRIDAFVTAYAVFRSAYCAMAANALHGSEEQVRLERAAACYRETLISERALCS